MKYFVSLILVLFAITQVNGQEYFPAQLKKTDPPTIQLQSDFSRQKIDIPLVNRQPLTVYNESGARTIISANSQMIMESTLDQIYRGAQKASPFEDFFSKEEPDVFNIVSPDALRLKDMFNELIMLKMQEDSLDRIGSSGKVKSELVELKVKKEGEIKEKIVKIEKAELEKAVEVGSVEVGEAEVIPYSLPTDYNGEDNWAVKKRTEATDILKIDCVVCGPRKQVIRNQLQSGTDIASQTLNALISKKYESYSKDSKALKLVEFALSKKRNPIEYKKNTKEGSPENRYCYKYVKDALEQAKLVGDRPAGVSPRYAGEQLKSRGFVNIMDDHELAGKITNPSQAPKGAILVYEPVSADRIVRAKDKQSNRWMWVPDYGHIEIKTDDVGKPGYVSDYFSNTARTGDSLVSEDRKLIGIYVKPESK